MRWNEPAWLWALWGIPLLYAWIFYNDRYLKKRLEQFAHKGLWQRLIPDLAPKRRLLKGVIICCGFFALFLTLAQPEYGYHDETVTISGVDIMVLLDVSLSMDAQDIAPSRIQKAKHWIKRFVNSIGSDRVGLIPFAKSNYVACPLTTDLGYVKQMIDAASTKIISHQGTDIGAALSTALLALKRSSQEKVGDSTHLSHAVILISDGEDHDSAALKVAAEMKTQSVKLIVIGVGTLEGGKIPISDNLSQNVYKKDKKGKVVVTRFNPTFLKNLAQEAGGEYFDLNGSSSGNASLLKMVQDLGGMDPSVKTERTVRIYESRFQIPLLFAFLCFLCDCFIASRIVFLKKKVFSKAFFAFFLLFSVSAFGRETTNFKAYLENRRGMAQLQENRPQEALLSFGAAQAQEPSIEELQFNQGVAYAVAQQWKEAIEKFESTASSTDPVLQLVSHYNLGKALSERKNFDKAAKAYFKAIQLAQELQQKPIEEAARKNLELLGQEEEKPPSQKNKKDSKDNPPEDQKPSDEKKDPSSDADQKKEGSDKKDQPKNEGSSKEKENSEEKEQKEDQSKDSKGPKEDGKQQDQKEKEEQKNKEKSGSTSGAQGFQSEKLSPEDAKKVMSELQAKEKLLHQNLQNRQSKKEATDEDW